jgi:RNA polymerase sigma-32 factor
MAKQRRPMPDDEAGPKQHPTSAGAQVTQQGVKRKSVTKQSANERRRAAQSRDDAGFATDSDDRGSASDADDEALSGEIVDDAEVQASEQDAQADEPLEGELDDDALAAEVVDLDAAPLPPVASGEGSSLARYDALQAYMRDVHRYQVLDAETQRELAVRYREQGDLDAARELVTSNLRLVVKIAYDYRRAYRNVMDLIQEGNIGLMQAVKKYDPYKGVKLSSYAAWWIRAYILRFILNNWRLVKLGTTQAQRKLFFNLSKEKARLSAMGIEPSAENIAQRLDVSVEDVNSMDRRLSAGEMSLDTPVGGDEGKSQTRVDLMPALGSRVDELLADEELGRLLHAEMHGFGETLKGKERQIFYERLMAEDPRTLQELGSDFGVSRERVRQLEKRLQERLRKYLEEKLGSEVLQP